MRTLASLLSVCGALWACGGSAGGTGDAGQSGGSASAGSGQSTGGTVSAGQGGGSVGGAGVGGGSVGGAATGSGGLPGGGAGGSSGGAGTGGASGAGGGSSMADVQAVFDAHCVTCHDKARMGLPTFGTLSLVAGDSHAALVGKPASETCGGTLVVAGDASKSYLWHKLTDATPCDGQHMPRAFEILPPTPLTAQELATISGWIGAGAPP